jgi:hypothetical protein
MLASLGGPTGPVTIEKMRALLKFTARTAARYLENLEQRSVAPSPEALKRLTDLYERLPELPIGAECVLESLDRIGSPTTMGMAGHRYFAFVIGGSLPTALAANWLAGAWDQCPGLYAICSGADNCCCREWNVSRARVN